MPQESKPAQVAQEAPEPTERVLVRAAGGIVLRRRGTGRARGRGTGADRWEVVIVHRPDREDWSLPKGKLEEGETFEQAALREVAEETGLECRLGPFAGSVGYLDRKGRQKIVAYWLMEVTSGELEPSGEVDDARWVPLELAGRALTYERDRDLLASIRIPSLARSA